jgi:hypothetical protein
LVVFPTLPPYRSDTSINFFLGERKKGFSPSIRAAGGKRYKTVWWGRKATGGLRVRLINILGEKQ